MIALLIEMSNMKQILVQNTLGYYSSDNLSDLEISEVLDRLIYGDLDTLQSIYFKSKDKLYIFPGDVVRQSVITIVDVKETE